MTTPLLHDATEVAARMFGDPGRGEFVRRRMASGRWPHRKIGRTRYMTDADIQAAMDLEFQQPDPAPAPHPSGLSPRTRRKRATA